MPDQTIVAVYDTPAHAELAVQDLLAAGVPDAAMERHAQEGSYTGASLTLTTRPADERGFWARIFGGEPDHDTAVYDHSIQSGSTVVSVKAPGEHVRRVLEILESHAPVDLDKRARAVLSGNGSSVCGPDRSASVDMAHDDAPVSGNRVINAGTGTIRQFVSEPGRPQCNAGNDVFRSGRQDAPSDSAAIGGFSDTVVEMKETMEHVVIAKRVFVREEIILRRSTTDRIETVRDTVRVEDITLVKLPDSTTTDAPSAPPGRL